MIVNQAIITCFIATSDSSSMLNESYLYILMGLLGSLVDEIELLFDTLNSSLSNYKAMQHIS